jgi:hypothetical protein
VIFHREKAFTVPIGTLLEMIARQANIDSGLLEYMKKF